MKTRLASVLALASVLLVAAFGAAAGAAGSSVHIRNVDSKAFPRVTVTVSSEGAVSPTAIQLTENGRPVTILSTTTLAQSGRKFDVVLVIDRSDSVAGAPLQAAIAAAQNFVQRLPAGVPVGIVTFSDRVEVAKPVTADHAAALSSIGNIAGTKYGTKLYDAVSVSSTLFSGSAQHNVVLLTDGTDVGSHRSLGGAIADSRNHHVGLFTIALGSNADVPVLRKMSDETSGGFLAAVQSDLSSIYQGIATELSNQYLVSYRSTAPRGRQVTLSVAAAGATDTAITLFPATASPPPSSVPPAPSKPLLHGDVGLTIILALSFLAAFVILALSLGFGSQARRQRRLSRLMAASPGSNENLQEEAARGNWVPEPLVAVAELVAGKGLVPKLERRLEQGEIKLQAGEFLLISAGGAVIGGLVVGLVLSSPLFGLIGGAVLGIVPFLVLAIAIRRRSNALHAQLPDVLMMLASSLRAGHGFLQALDTVAQEVGDPISSELARVVAEVRLGRPADEAMTAMAERVGSDDFRWSAMAVNIQREVGGNLAEILDTVAETVRDRDTVRRQIDVLSAEGRLSMYILVALPFLIALYIAKVNPSYIKLLFNSTLGWVLISGASVLMAVGIFWMRKIVRIDV